MIKMQGGADHQTIFIIYLYSGLFWLQTHQLTHHHRRQSAFQIFHFFPAHQFSLITFSVMNSTHVFFRRTDNQQYNTVLITYFSGALIFTEVNENSLLEEIEADDKQEAYTQLRQPKGMMVMVMVIKLKRFLLSCEQAYGVHLQMQALHEMVSWLWFMLRRGKMQKTWYGGLPLVREVKNAKDLLWRNTSYPGRLFRIPPFCPNMRIKMPKYQLLPPIGHVSDLPPLIGRRHLPSSSC